MMVVRDLEDHEIYPVFVYGDEDAQAKIDRFNQEWMQRVFGVYRTDHDLREQIEDPRCWNV